MESLKTQCLNKEQEKLIGEIPSLLRSRDKSRFMFSKSNLKTDKITKLLLENSKLMNKKLSS